MRSWDMVARYVVPEINGHLPVCGSQDFVSNNRGVFDRAKEAIMAKISITMPPRARGDQGRGWRRIGQQRARSDKARARSRRADASGTGEPPWNPGGTARSRPFADFSTISGSPARISPRGVADLRGVAARHPERIASVTLLCPAVLDTVTLAPLAGRLLVVTGDSGPGARRVQAGLPDLPKATRVVLGDYVGLTWADIAEERGDAIGAAMHEFLAGRDGLPAAGPPEQDGEVAGISYRVRGAGRRW